MLDRLEARKPQLFVFEDANKSSKRPLRFGIEGNCGRIRETEEGKFGLEVVGGELTAMVAAQLRAMADTLVERVEAVTFAWRTGFWASKWVARRAAMDAGHSPHQ